MGRIIASKWPNTEAASNTPREWLYIKDLLSSAELLLNSGSMSGEYFAASGRVASEYEIMMGLQRISEGLPIDIAKHEFTPANCDRLQAMGWNSKYELREALEHTLSWHAVNTWASNEARNE
jgi:dTDP-D-glucose 4,6-dehydratase